MTSQPTGPQPAPTRPGEPLASVLAGWAGEQPGRDDLADVVLRLAAAAARVGRALAAAGPPDEAQVREVNVSGDVQSALDLAAEARFVDALAGSAVRSVLSEESPAPIPVDPDGSLAVVLDPLDGSGNVAIDASAGAIFGVLPAGASDPDPLTPFRQPGRSLLAAGIVVFGPRTVLTVSLGAGVDSYRLDAGGSFVLERRGVTMPAESNEFAINAANARHWPAGVKTYVNDLVSGSLGPRERDFTMRWLGAVVAETQRILLRGGIYLYPADARPGHEQGRLRLTYEAAPIAYLCEQAGGAASDGRTPVLDLVPTDPHQRVPLFFGSTSKVARVERYLSQVHPAHEELPLFAYRGLLRG